MKSPMNLRLKHLQKLLALSVLMMPLLGVSHANSDFSGRWEIDTSKSTALDPWRSLAIEIVVDGDQVSITRHYGGGSRVAQESMTVDTSIPSQTVEVEGWWDNRHIGAYLGGGKEQTVSAEWVDDGQTLQLNIEMILETSQAETSVRVLREMRLSRDGKTLRVLQLRSSRNQPIVRVFTKA
jgi:hypothetical protein